MINCPWCHTSYVKFKATCEKCGGQIPPPITVPLNAPPRIPPPPPAPRPFAKGYARQLAFSDRWANTALIFLLLGIIVTCLGIMLILGIVTVTALTAMPFLGAGLVLFLLGVLIFQLRYKRAQTAFRVLREGQVANGQIESVQRSSARDGGHNPWVIKYSFQVMGQDYEDQVSTLNNPTLVFKPGSPAHVLYLPDKPELNSLYPHP